MFPGNPQPLALSDRIAVQSGMMADNGTIARYDFTRFLRYTMGLQKFHVIIVRNEADLLAFMLLRHRERVFRCEFPDAGLFNLTDWENDMLKLFLRQSKEKVGLILGGI